jgi:hypothetical protein
MFTYEEAKGHLLEHLTHDIQAHAAGDYWQIGKGFEEFDIRLPRDNDPRFKNFHITLNFWDGWQDARNHNWRYYEGISQSDWPELAKAILQCIEEDKEITNELILERFFFQPKVGIISKLKKALGLKSKTNET